MKRIEGKIIVTWIDDPTDEDILQLEIYLNDTITNIVKANKGALIRVHLNGEEDVHSS